ncbi:hypothetical protein [Streptomyces sp. NPDC023838]|uniref:hypothetical protein n=1 Tax=Streptomyces sp. NPDC023838 TaxID=3154325 RepID=UPI0033F416A4
MDQRTRQRLPALPTVVRAAKELLDNAQTRLRAVQTAPAGGRFEILGETFTHAKRPGSTWAYDVGGRRRDLDQWERRAFWGWAMGEFLQRTLEDRPGACPAGPAELHHRRHPQRTPPHIAPA